MYIPYSVVHAQQLERENTNFSMQHLISCIGIYAFNQLKHCTYFRRKLISNSAMEETIVITGASSGIGKACAEKLAAPGKRFILTARRTERLHELAAELEKSGALVWTYTLDVQSREACQKWASQIPDAFQNIRVLINNAGLASGLSAIQDGDYTDWDRMIDTNVKGLLYTTEAILPFLRQTPRSHILNVGSIAGKEVYANGNVYCASKHAVDALTRSMRIDLLPLGIKVSSVSPGMVETEFSLVRFKGDSERAAAVYNGLEPLKPSDIAEAVNYIISAPHHVTVADIVLFPAAQASSRDVLRQPLA
jgi:NADP-dependent 3-hydroxy acid dehydrogenase YdfG